jgi:hypothetical protein
MTRKRTRENLLQILCEPCSFCEGRGYVLSGKSVAFKVLREIRNDLPRFCGREIALTVNPQVAEQLLTSGQNALQELSGELGKRIEVRARPGLHQEQFELTALDQGEAVSIPLKWLGSPADADDEKAESSEAGEGAGEAEAVAEAVDAADVPEKEADEKANAEDAPVVEEESAASSEASNPSDAVPQSDGDQSEEAEQSPLAASNPGEPEAPEESDEEPEMRAVALEREEGEAAQDAPEPEEEPKPDQDEPEVLDGEAETRILPGSRKLEES